jgi:hypothetical protein
MRLKYSCHILPHRKFNKILNKFFCNNVNILARKIDTFFLKDTKPCSPFCRTKDLIFGILKLQAYIIRALTALNEGRPFWKSTPFFTFYERKY